MSCGFKGSSGYYELMAGPAVNNGQWHTVQCVKTSSTVKVVVDGSAFSKSATLGSIAPSNTDGVPIGARPGSEYFNGLTRRGFDPVRLIASHTGTPPPETVGSSKRVTIAAVLPRLAGRDPLRGRRDLRQARAPAPPRRRLGGAPWAPASPCTGSRWDGAGGALVGVNLLRCEGGRL